jgi:hypothetical protein
MKKMTLFLAVGALSLPLIASASPMKPGLWRVTIEGPQGARTSEHCISKEEAAKLEPPKGRSADCKVDSFNVSGTTVTWKMSCPSEKMSMEAKTVYHGDTFTGETHIKMGEREMTQKSSGKFLGACPSAK